MAWTSLLHFADGGKLRVGAVRLKHRLLSGSNSVILGGSFPGSGCQFGVKITYSGRPHS